MTYALPWFGLLYAAAFFVGVLGLVYSERLGRWTMLGIAIAVTVVAGLAAGMAARGMWVDVSGEPFAMKSAPRVLPARLGPAKGRGQISIDALGPVGHRAASRFGHLVLRAGESLRLDGWAYDVTLNAACSDVAAIVDDHAYAGSYGLERPDVATAWGASHLETGYTITIDGSELRLGHHHLEVRCIESTGASLSSPTTTFEVVR